MRYLTVQEVTCADPGSFKDRLDPLMEALLRLEAADSTVDDPDLAADLSMCRVDVQMIVEAADPAAAMVKALATTRRGTRAASRVSLSQRCGWRR